MARLVDMNDLELARELADRYLRVMESSPETRSQRRVALIDILDVVEARAGLVRLD